MSRARWPPGSPSSLSSHVGDGAGVARPALEVDRHLSPKPAATCRSTNADRDVEAATDEPLGGRVRTSRGSAPRGLHRRRAAWVSQKPSRSAAAVSYMSASRWPVQRIRGGREHLILVQQVLQGPSDISDPRCGPSHPIRWGGGLQPVVGESGDVRGSLLRGHRFSLRR